MVNSRRKGTQFEREVANLLKPIYPDAARSYGQCRQGHDAPDVDGTPWWVECGHGKRMNPAAKFNQAVKDAAAADDPRPPIAICRVDRGPITVTMGFEEFMGLVKEAQCQANGTKM